MHRWFRFCALIALMAFSHNGMAQSPAATPIGTGTADDEVPVSKHRLKPTANQLLQHQIELQGKQIEQLGTQIDVGNKQLEAQTKAMEELGKRAELQSKQIETLNADLNRLTSVLLAHQGESAAPATATAPTPAAPAQAGVPAPAVQTTQEAAVPVHPAESVAGVPDATPADGTTHVVKRGENLISIARQHGTTVTELLKVNKIEDERKLQIGQTLLLPKLPPKPDSQ